METEGISHPHPLMKGTLWLLYYLYVWAILWTTGALLGTTLALILGPLFTQALDMSYLQIIAKGSLLGATYIGKIWGTGGAIVACFIKAHALKKRGLALHTHFFRPFA